MPSRKQRRRRQKLRRHEWEEVLVDEEGNEVVVERGPKEPDSDEKPARRSAAGGTARRPLRTVEPPSWRRVAKRGAIFAPLMFVMVHFLSSDRVALGGKIVQTVFLLAFFLPFSYVMDTIAYRTYRKRVQRGA